MTRREKLVVAVLLLVARILTEDDALAGEIKALATNISVRVEEESA